MSANVSVSTEVIACLQCDAASDDVTMRDGATAIPDLALLFVFVRWEEFRHLLHLLSAKARRVTLREALVQGSQVHRFIVDK